MFEGRHAIRSATIRAELVVHRRVSILYYRKYMEIDGRTRALIATSCFWWKKKMTLRFVHLSDIHFGQEKHGTGPINDDVRRELLRDCRRMIADGYIVEPATGILLTGDVAYAGKEAEFKRAVEWLDELASVIKCDRKQVQVIPGNHDVDLQTLDDQAKLFQGMLRKMSVEDIQAYLNSVADSDNHPLMQKLTDYRSFAGAYGSDFKSVGQPITIKSYSLGGGKDIRIIGLCSVLISDLSDKLETMYLGQNQYVVPRSDDHEDIVMVHHPLPWFKDSAIAEKYLNARARVLMSGHEHLPAFPGPSFEAATSSYPRISEFKERFRHATGQIQHLQRMD
ncbi:metallophosphoesterase family protein [Labrys okinawensis]|uniref:metallophosphoesterase family protein n=1 Tax=Labrys okinawensis TaxID=346911 RepID=UPI0039BCB35C